MAVDAKGGLPMRAPSSGATRVGGIAPLRFACLRLISTAGGGGGGGGRCAFGKAEAVLLKERARWISAGIGDGAASLCAARGLVLDGAVRGAVLAAVVGPDIGTCRGAANSSGKGKGKVGANSVGIGGGTGGGAVAGTSTAGTPGGPTGGEGTCSNGPLAELWVFAKVGAHEGGDGNDVEAQLENEGSIFSRSARGHPALGGAFEVVDVGVWTGGRDTVVSRAVVAAVEDAVVDAVVESSRGLLIAPRFVFVPAAGSSFIYRLNVALGPDSDAIIRAQVFTVGNGVRKATLDDLEDEEESCEGGDNIGKDPSVIIAPLGFVARMRKSRRAGDALAASVRARWSEAALLPKRGGDNSVGHDARKAEERAVVFVDVGDDGKELLMPIPIECLLRLDNDSAGEFEPASRSMRPGPCVGNTDLASAQGTKRKAAVLCSAPPPPPKALPQVWRSLKRPRSPSADLEEIERAAKKEELVATAAGSSDVAAGSSSKQQCSERAVATDAVTSAAAISTPVGGAVSPDGSSASTVPTAGSIRRAIEAIDAENPMRPPSLRHPLAPEELDIAAAASVVGVSVPRKDGAGKSGESGDAKKGSPDEGSGEGEGVVDAVSGAPASVAAPPAVGVGDISTADAGESAAVSSGALGDVSGFGDTDSDLLGLGGGSGRGGTTFEMDELCGFDDDVTQFFAGADAVAAPISTGTPVLGRSNSVTSPDGGRGAKEEPSPMDVDTEAPAGDPKAPASPSAGASAVASIRPSASRSVASPRAGAAAWLSMLDVPSPVERPSTPQRAKELQEFLAEDLARRLRTVTHGSDDGGKSVAMATFASRPSLERRSGSVAPVAVGLNSEVYIPKRQMRSFSLRRGGVEEKSDPPSSDSESDDDDVGGDGAGVRPVVSSGKVDAGKLEKELSVGGPGGVSGSSGSVGEAGSSGTSGAVAVVQTPPQRNCADSVASAVAKARTSAREVPVDCASACFVLVSSAARVFEGTPSWLSGVGSVAILPPPIAGAMSPAVAQSALGPEASVNSTSTCRPTSGRSKTDRAEAMKKEKEATALLSLLQMQMIAPPQLQLVDCREVGSLFWECEREGFDGKVNGSSNGVVTEFDLSSRPHSRPISSVGMNLVNSPRRLALVTAGAAAVRRAVHGLPRLLLSSQLFSRFAMESSKHSAPLDDGEVVDASTASGISVCGPSSISEAPKLSDARVCVGFDREWIETGAGVLPLWEKSGLEPYSPVKNVQYAALAPKELADDARCFFRDVSAAYEECSLGRHSVMPFDAVSLIANSVPNDPPSETRHLDPDIVSPAEARMVQQYHLAAAGLATKLTAVSRDARKTDSIGPNFVIYIVSPFHRARRAAIAALMRAVTPLVSCIPNTVVPSGQNMSLPSGLVSTPWRPSPAQPLAHDATAAAQQAQSQSSAPGMGSSNGPPPAPGSSSGPGGGVALALTVRVLPWEAVERYPMSDPLLTYRTFRPQLVKSVAFAVYSTLRGRRLRRVVPDGEMGVSCVTEGSDELLSPMTPDVALVGSPSGSVLGPLSPSSSSSVPPGENGGGGSEALAATAWDQSMSSFLYDPPFVLAGVGQNMGQSSPCAESIFHLAYTFVESVGRCIFAWTDSRGEVLDVATVPMATQSQPGGTSRTRMFARMWSRGQLWWLSFADQTCVTIAKVGQHMSREEREDWESVVTKFINVTNARAEFPEDRVETKLRFPVERARRPVASNDSPDLVKDVATPATPASMPVTSAHPISSSTPSTKAGNDSAPEVSSTSLRSVTILTIRENETPELFASEATEDILVLSDKESDCEARASLVVDVASLRKRRQIDLDMLSHFGRTASEKGMDCQWDGSNPLGILKCIALNFHALRTVSSLPCWPTQEWRASYPIHITVISNLRSLLTRLVRPQERLEAVVEG